MAGIPSVIVRAYPLEWRLNIMGIRRRDFPDMSQSGSGIRANMALLCRVHPGIALLLRVSGWARRVDDCRIDDRAALHDVPRFRHDAVDCFKESLIPIVFLRKPPESEQRCCIRRVCLNMPRR